MVEVSADTGIADRAPRGNLQINSTQGRKTAVDNFAEIFGLRLGPSQCGFEQLPCFLLHGASVASGADAEPPLGSFRQSADRNASHAINDITDCSDCKSWFFFSHDLYSRTVLLFRFHTPRSDLGGRIRTSDFPTATSRPIWHLSIGRTADPLPWPH